MRAFVLADPSVTSFQVPANFNADSNSVHSLGAGGADDGSRNGGGGGSYAASVNVGSPLTPGSTVPVHVGPAKNFKDGGDTYIGAPTFAASVVAAKGGKKDMGDGTGGPGGDASQNIGSVKNSGGRGAPAVGDIVSGITPGGGGAPGGPSGTGADAVGRFGGVGDPTGLTIGDLLLLRIIGDGAVGDAQGQGGRAATLYGGGGTWNTRLPSGGIIVIIDDPVT
jgi:hypothetical protein